ncbi:hypothetical protein C9374_004119 [Naegleria lovaniensis]|uniref:U3 small nucleolar RNA-associated protein 25 n=1 Tax=Naegleria lovaniensis TaxID=51637 RepID=A0AA88KKU3_NAELO|nr:uncharacterized protein C9374_004119 [Naegleria lovaniensis]KAG2383448.1 hypothetical protein C9374_004119 [Naegleria lovaniensis]
MTLKKKVRIAASPSDNKENSSSSESTMKTKSSSSGSLNIKSLIANKQQKRRNVEQNHHDHSDPNDDEKSSKKVKFSANTNGESISILDKLRNKFIHASMKAEQGGMKRFTNKFHMDPFASLLSPKMEIPESFAAQHHIDEYTMNIPKYHFQNTQNPIFIEYRTNDLSDNSYQKLCVCIDFDKKVKDVWYHHFYRPWQGDELKDVVEKLESREMTVIDTINSETVDGDKALVLGDMIQFVGTMKEEELNAIYKSFTKEERVKKLLSTELSENEKLEDVFITETKKSKFEFSIEDTPLAGSNSSTNILDKIKRDKSYTLNELLVEDDLIRKWKEYLDQVTEDEKSSAKSQQSNQSSHAALRLKIKTGSSYSNPKSITPPTHFRDDFQGRLFAIMNDYRDLYFPNCTLDNHRVCVETYTLHIVNHLLKTKRYEWYNDTKREFYSKEQYTVRDDSYNTAKILVLVPNRFVAFLIVELMLELIPKLLSIRRREAFELTFDADEDDEEIKKTKPVWWQQIFEGNTNEEFSLGLKLKDHHGQLEIMAPVAESDVIIATPIGIQLENVADRYERFLSSIEVCIIDQCDKLLMQNWEHVTKTLDIVNVEEQQKFTFDLDFDILKEYHIQGFAKYFRQTIVLSSYMSPDINGLVTKYCRNMRGLVKTRSFYDGVLTPLAGNIPQIFERISCTDPTAVDDERYNYFVNAVFPRFKNSMDGRFLIIVSSYLDFVRLRNYFDMCNIPFFGISEYTEKTKNVLTKFRQDSANFLVYTERHFYYHAPKLADFKINQIVFYSLPENAFIYEIFGKKGINIRSQYPSCRILSLFTTFDALKLERIVGTQRCKHLLTSDTDINLIDK